MFNYLMRMPRRCYVHLGFGQICQPKHVQLALTTTSLDYVDLKNSALSHANVITQPMGVVVNNYHAA